ncbi:unnamed protein product [Dibothriocephalus latus]|uniref:MPN domain-containing protein n=1 Tax=Dibothriocephalus latus TaxID=60516 RepID=A0A3P6Q2M8_DIBLA|nr:unnamed protein product [Dibothriocephalus latus]
MDTQRIKRVQVDGLVLTKIITHSQEETLLSSDSVSGVLLGLTVGDTLEITNCFPLPKLTDDDQSSGEAVSAYEFDMIRNMRQLNSDYLSVGFYQSGYGSSFLSRSTLESLFQYQMQISEAVLLTYDPSCATRGQLGMKAFHLSEQILNAMLDTEMRLRLNPNLKVRHNFEFIIFVFGRESSLLIPSYGLAVT